MAKLKLPEQLKSWKVLSALPSNSGYPVYRITRVEFDGSKSFAALTVVTFEGKDYNSDNVELITEEASFVKTVVKLRGVSRYIDAVVDNKPTKETITLWLLARDLPTISEKLGGKAPTDSEIVDFGLQLSETLDIRPMSEYDGAPVYKIVFMCTDRHQLDEPMELLKEHFVFCVQNLEAVKCLNGEVFGLDFNKGIGIHKLCEHLGKEIGDTIGFGDSMNDKEMSEAVGYSVCMDNGHPEMKKMADYVCPAVGDDGLYKAFEKLGLI